MKNELDLIKSLKLTLDQLVEEYILLTIKVCQLEKNVEDINKQSLQKFYSMQDEVLDKIDEIIKDNV